MSASKIQDNHKSDHRSQLRASDVITHCFHHNARLTSWCTLMSYLVLSRNGEESFNKFLTPDPDPDHFTGGSSKGYISFYCVKKTQLNRDSKF